MHPSIASSLIVVAVAACATNGEEVDESAPSAEVAVDTAPRPMPSPQARDTEPWMLLPARVDAPGEWTAGTVVGGREGAGVQTLAEARVGHHPELDRFVLEFAGDTIPRYRVEYVDEPIRACGSGHVVPVAGDGFLSISLSSARAHDERGRPTVRKRALEPSYELLRQATLVCDFEAEVRWVLGVASPERFRVLELEKPTRLVVDVRND